jgi:hypothetical protein
MDVKKRGRRGQVDFWNLRSNLSAFEKHHILFFSPVLNRLIVPFVVHRVITVKDRIL